MLKMRRDEGTHRNTMTRRSNETSRTMMTRRRDGANMTTMKRYNEIPRDETRQQPRRRAGGATHEQIRGAIGTII